MIYLFHFRKTYRIIITNTFQEDEGTQLYRFTTIFIFLFLYIFIHVLNEIDKIAF